MARRARWKGLSYLLAVRIVPWGVITSGWMNWVDAASRSPFRARVLASKLLTAEQFDAAVASMWPASEGSQPAAAPHLADEPVAARLVELGHLNRWQADQLLAGRTKFTLGPYRVLESIGKGGMGEVYKAEHDFMGRIVAIKVLPRHKSTPEAVTGFLREIRAQSKLQLDHSNLVRALDAGFDGNVYYLVTEYVPGTDLRRLLYRRRLQKQGPLDMATAASIISQAASGLEHAHETGLIHRDVKPGNILVTPEGRAKVSDLGLVDFLENDPAADWQKGKIVGTADYLSPEQIISPDKLTPASDVYSLGCTLYYCVTGKVPFPGGTAKEKSYRHCHQQPMNPRAFNPELSDEFIEVIAEMMEKDPAKRIPNAAAVARRLAPWITSERPAIALGVGQSGGFAFGAPPAPPPVRGATDLPIAGYLSDTQPSFDFGPQNPSSPDDSPSQSSQATHPVASATDDTIPSMPARRESKFKGLIESSLELPARLQEKSGMPTYLLVLAVLGAAAAAACLLAIAIASW